ncbi:MAG: ABC transporter ATP-binding protein [Candidatus Latescibacteria bacterium]|nr:ABC transporter ATP-binding protein [Candidatus Latescibacterota bacterium]
MIAVRNLTKVYHMGDFEIHALRGITLDVEPGEFAAIMGASGSGKSTFMNIVGCLDRPTSGQYLLDGIDVSQLSRDDLARVRNQKVGFVFQGFNLLSRTTALENVELPLMYNHTPMKEMKKQAMRALKIVGLEDREHHRPSQLSGGQQQRVAIARALVNNPALILADEPTGNLDSRTSIDVMTVFQRLNREGKTIILITHEPDIAKYAKRVVVFKDGRVLRDTPVDTPRDAEEELRALPVENE